MAICSASQRLAETEAEYKCGRGAHQKNEPFLEETRQRLLLWSRWVNEFWNRTSWHGKRRLCVMGMTMGNGVERGGVISFGKPAWNCFSRHRYNLGALFRVLPSTLLHSDSQNGMNSMEVVQGILSSQLIQLTQWKKLKGTISSWNVRSDKMCSLTSWVREH